MIRLVVCNWVKEEGLRLQGLVDRYAKSEGILNVDPLVTDSCIKLQSILTHLRPNFVDIAICRIDKDSPGFNCARKTGLIESLKERTPSTRFILISTDPEDAVCAYDTGSLFIQLPMQSKDFIRVIGETLKDVAREKRRPFSAKAPKSIVAMDLNDITFVETNKKGPIIHLPNTRTITTRGTLQALYDQLNGIDERFIRAGGSFIVNLDNVRSVGDSSVVFGDGETIILPIRARKPIRDAYTAYLKGA